MFRYHRICFCICLAIATTVAGQNTDSLNATTDSLYIASIENAKGKPKLLHAEPLYIDLIRDLGARKGEKEWNFGTGFTDNLNFDRYEALVEYEWAPLNRLGLEVELPFTFYSKRKQTANSSSPSSKLNSLKVAAQYTVHVNEQSKTSLAVGYLHEFKLPSFDRYDRFGLTGHLSSPFFIAARRWGQNWHTLLYTGPLFTYSYESKSWYVQGQYHFSTHYMISGTRNFIGLETNAYSYSDVFDVTLRPQMRLSVTDNLLIGIVAGIPINRSDERMSSFLRIIYEPTHRHAK